MIRCPGEYLLSVGCVMRSPFMWLMNFTASDNPPGGSRRRRRKMRRSHLQTDRQPLQIPAGPSDRPPPPFQRRWSCEAHLVNSWKCEASLRHCCLIEVDWFALRNTWGVCAHIHADPSVKLSPLIKNCLSGSWRCA